MLLYILDLNYQCPHFAVEIKRHRDTGESKGFAFLTFEDPADKEDAVKGMDGKVSIQY